MSFRRALLWWLKLGLISFGGPAGQIAIMHRELVGSRRWISEGRFLHALNYCMLLPGPEAQQLATYIGWLMHGVRGGLAAGLLFILPAWCLLALLAWLYLQAGPALAADLLYGVRVAVLAIVLHAAWRLARNLLGEPRLWPLPVASLAMLSAGVPFPLLIVLAALYGWLLRASLANHRGATKPGSGSGAAPALIDDHTPPPDHARPGQGRWWQVLAVGIGGGVLLYGLLVASGGSEGVLAQMARFFTQAALVTFGGAYAVMPYVFHGAVETQGWLGATQMMDGLALGETTPGPLIIVVVFVGFVGAFQSAVGDPLVAGLMGAFVAGAFTFLPSFLFILGGAPWVERTRGLAALAGPMRAITAAVVGAILSLAALFAGEVVLQEGRFDALATALALVALAALASGRAGVMTVLGICGALGYLLPLAV